MNDRFVVLAMDNGRNWTVTANDRFGEIDPVLNLVANDRYRRTTEMRRAPLLTFILVPISAEAVGSKLMRRWPHFHW